MGNWTERFDYCNGCLFWGYFAGFYGCRKFHVYAYADFDRLCGSRYKIPR